MRILMVSEFVPPVLGGLEFHVLSLASELTKQGHDVRVATLTSDPAPQHFPIYSIAGVAHLLPHEDRQRPFQLPVGDPLAARQLHRIVQAFRPDVIHGHNWLASATRRPPWRSRTVPLVVTLHDYALVCALRTLFDADERACSGPAAWKCLKCSARVMGPARASVLVPATAAGRRMLAPTSVVAVSAAVRDAVQPYVDVPIDVVANFAQVAEAEPLPDDFPRDRYVLFAGDNREHKGIADLLAAWAAHAVDHTTLVIATTRPLGRAVPAGVYPTSLSSGQMVTAWRNAALAVVPSRWPEPCGTVVLEAYRQGTPVIATRVGGLRELVDNDRTGLLVEPDQPQELGAAMRRVLTDDELRKRLAQGASEAANSHSAAQTVEALLAVYERAIVRASRIL